MNYYNEFDPKAAAWLRELIKEGLIPNGHVDERSITDVAPAELAGFTQCHFFAGIGGWSEALRLAGWPSDKPVWTGSCPCQPFSSAGKQLGPSDSRHLWPEFARLIKACNPPVVFGEQVASKAGREWLAGVFADLEAMGYSRAGADLCAAGVGSPQIRQRLYWVANSNQARWSNPPSWKEGSELNWIRTVDLGGGTSFWPGCREQVGFKDGSSRRTKPGVGILVDGFPGRVDIVGSIGNAIVPQVAAEFICAFLESQSDLNSTS